MRILLVVSVFLLAFVQRANAAIYSIDLSTKISGGFTQGPCYCDTSFFTSPVFPAKPGDTFLFGSVTVDSFLGGYGPDAYLYLLDYYYTYGTFPPPYYVLGAVGVGFNGELPYPTNFGGILLENPVSTTFDLTYFIPDNAFSIQVGWVGDSYSYTPPAIAPPVPEPSTWAMLLLGFAGIGFIAHRRSRKATTV